MAQVVAAFPMGGVALDVGAWYGPWTYWLSRRAAHVTAFEPNPEVAKVLEHAAAPNVTVRRMAVSDHVGNRVARAAGRRQGHRGSGVARGAPGEHPSRRGRDLPARRPRHRRRHAAEGRRRRSRARRAGRRRAADRGVAPAARRRARGAPRWDRAGGRSAGRVGLLGSGHGRGSLDVARRLRPRRVPGGVPGRARARRRTCRRRSAAGASTSTTCVFTHPLTTWDVD